MGGSLPQCRNLTRQARLKGAQAAAVARKARADAAYTDLVPIIAELREAGQPLRAIAEELNRLGHTTRRGKPWNPVQVARVLERAA